jgi:hypothetical protein
MLPAGISRQPSAILPAPAERIPVSRIQDKTDAPEKKFSFSRFFKMIPEGGTRHPEMDTFPPGEGRAVMSLYLSSDRG